MKRVEITLGIPLVSPNYYTWKYRLIEPFTCRVGDATITVPERFEAGCSIPRLVHDWLYATHTTTRQYADRIFVSILEQHHMPRWRCWVMYAALRLFGGWAWKKAGGPSP